MTPDERQMIADLFERMRSFGPVDKDSEADAVISQYARQTPDALYKLVQSVLVQENTIEQTGQRVQELEDNVRYLEDQLQQTQAPAPRSGGSFLGGARNAAAREPMGSVPVTNRSTGFGQQSPQQSSPWAQPAGGYQQPPMQQQPMQQQAQPARGGGFLRSAMATAAGVAGGIFAANAIKDMMGGGKSGEAQAGQTGEASPYEVNQNDPGNGYQSPEDNDPGNSGGDDNQEY